MRRFAWLFGMAGVLVAMGCVDIQQEIYVNHDGSGKIVEKVAVTDRGLRLYEGLQKRTGKSDAGAPPVLLTEEAFQMRMKALGEVTLVSKKENTLPDGRKQIEAVYTFKDIGKIKLWIVPTLAYKKAKDNRGAYDGGMKLQWTPQNVSWGRLYRETINVVLTTGGMPPQDLTSPATRQKFQRVLPIFTDMLKDFHVSIVLIAPIEAFEEPHDMLWGVPADANRVTLFRMEGEGVVQSPGFVLQLTMNEVIGGGDLARHHDNMSGVFSPMRGVEHGYGMRFMKSTPAPATEEKK